MFIDYKKDSETSCFHVNGKVGRYPTFSNLLTLPRITNTVDDYDTEVSLKNHLIVIT